MYPFRRLTVWEKAHSLTLRVYASTDGATGRRFPELTTQLRRTIAAIPASIAEGAGQASEERFGRSLEVALGCARQADYHLLLAKELSMIPAREYAHLEARLSEVQGMLMGLRKRVRERMRDASRRPAKLAR